jgi:hypothetical protein
MVTSTVGKINCVMRGETVGTQNRIIVVPTAVHASRSIRSLKYAMMIFKLGTAHGTYICCLIRGHAIFGSIKTKEGQNRSLILCLHSVHHQQELCTVVCSFFSSSLQLEQLLHQVLHFLCPVLQTSPQQTSNALRHFRSCCFSRSKGVGTSSVLSPANFSSGPNPD